jgi:CubicO group peptidase (beta-lactamase class C family)
VLLNVLALQPAGVLLVGLVNTASGGCADPGTARRRVGPGGRNRRRAGQPRPRPQSSGPCPILGDDVTFGLGFTPTTTRRPLGPNPHSFGHFGTGGALGFADPDAGIAFVRMNHVIPSGTPHALIGSLPRRRVTGGVDGGIRIRPSASSPPSSRPRAHPFRGVGIATVEGSDARHRI